jgi:hypothetical protein
MNAQSCPPPPHDPQWRVGKTTASINFVRLAESYIKELHGDPVAITILCELIDKVKRGEIVLPEIIIPNPLTPTK